MSPSLLDFLNHIMYECNYILQVCRDKSYEEVIENETLCKAVVRSLEIIGEAVKKLPDDFRVQYFQIPWGDYAGMRDILIHVYFGIDYEIVWSTINKDIPELRDELERIIQIESTQNK